MVIERKTKRWHCLHFRFMKIAASVLVGKDGKGRVVATDKSSV